MDVKAVAARLISPSLSSSRSGPFGSGGNNGFADLASQYAAAKAGIAPGKPAGEFTPIYRTAARYGEQERFEERDRVETRGVFEERAVMEERETIGSRDVVEERTVYETRAVYETRPVFEDQAVVEAVVEGTRSLSGFDKMSQAGIQEGSKFAVTVGDGATATITFVNARKISLAVNGTTREFNFENGSGAFRDGLSEALNSISGLSATFSADGRLELRSTNEQSVTLAPAGTLALAGVNSTLSKLGLTAGTTEAQVTGYRQVQTGTEEVQVGTEQVATGTAWVVTGIEHYVTGTQMVQVGTAQVQVGETQVVTGRETVSLGLTTVLEGHDRKLVGLERGDYRSPDAVGGTMSLMSGGGLPQGYVELLFGVLSPEAQSQAPAERSEGRAAYRAIQDEDEPGPSEAARPAAIEAGSVRTGLVQNPKDPGGLARE